MASAKAIDSSTVSCRRGNTPRRPPPTRFLCALENPSLGWQGMPGTRQGSQQGTTRRESMVACGSTTRQNQMISEMASAKATIDSSTVFMQARGTHLYMNFPFIHFYVYVNHSLPSVTSPRPPLCGGIMKQAHACSGWRSSRSEIVVWRLAVELEGTTG